LTALPLLLIYFVVVVVIGGSGGGVNRQCFFIPLLTVSNATGYLGGTNTLHSYPLNPL
jgi:hypothetical protein